MNFFFAFRFFIVVYLDDRISNEEIYLNMREQSRHHHRMCISIHRGWSFIKFAWLLGCSVFQI